MSVEQYFRTDLEVRLARALLGMTEGEHNEGCFDQDVPCPYASAIQEATPILIRYGGDRFLTTIGNELGSETTP